MSSHPEASPQEPTIYVGLDFDGVLHPEGCRREREFALVLSFEYAVRADLERGINIRIVITSMWRIDSSLESLRSHFSPDIAELIVGVTPDLSPRDKTEDQLELEAARWSRERDAQLAQMALDRNAGLRQRELEDWMRRNAPGAPWLAIDDRHHGFEPGCPNLILTDSERGLTVANILQFHERVQALTWNSEALKPSDPARTPRP